LHPVRCCLNEPLGGWRSDNNHDDYMMYVIVASRESNHIIVTIRIFGRNFTGFADHHEWKFAARFSKSCMRPLKKTRFLAKIDTSYSTKKTGF